MGRTKKSSTAARGATQNAESAVLDANDDGNPVNPLREYCTLLEEELALIWTLQSDVTREESCIKLRDRFVQIFSNESLTSALLSRLEYAVWLILSRVILTEGALKMPLSIRYTDPVQYKDTVRTMAALLCELHQNQEVSTEKSRICVIRIMKRFTGALDAGQWEVRYRILQFINCFFEKMNNAGAVFSAIEIGDDNKDSVRKELFIRTFDVKDKVAALAMEAIQYYQYEKEAHQTTRAFLVLHCRMQEHESGVVRAAALRSVHVCSASAAAIIKGVLDSSWEVRVAAYEVVGEAISPKIIKHHLRAFLILAGLNYMKAQVRAAALKCLKSWLVLCNGDYNGLMTDINVAAGHPLYATRQLGFEIFGESAVGVAAVENAAPPPAEAPVESNTVGSRTNPEPESVIANP